MLLWPFAITQFINYYYKGVEDMLHKIRLWKKATGLKLSPKLVG